MKRLYLTPGDDKVNEQTNRTLVTLVYEPSRLTEALTLWVRKVGDLVTLTVATAVCVLCTLVCLHKTPPTSECRLQ